LLKMLLGDPGKRLVVMLNCNWHVGGRYQTLVPLETESGRRQTARRSVMQNDNPSER